MQFIPESGPGLSPHGRGKRYFIPRLLGGLRSIPARAGETPSSPMTDCPMGVYPRTGGGNKHSRRRARSCGGLSPHGRGKPTHHAFTDLDYGSIPARAGETGRSGQGLCLPAVYPRTGGGNGQLRAAVAAGGGLSPHGRGKLRHRQMQILPSRSIPAWAGETPPPPNANLAKPVYPRTGGGNRAVKAVGNGLTGLSPHGRGKPGAVTAPAPRVRSIPARAGETG